MPTFFIDDKEISFEPGQDILSAALKSDHFIPHFCYHPGLSRVATCRMCLVDITDAGNGRPIPKLQTSCSTPVAEGMKVSTTTDRMKEARESVMEFLLVNHPLDCPICDQAGECDLQDYSFDYGTGQSTVLHQKRVYGRRDIGSFLELERNRCIHCTRCVRFTQEITETNQMGVSQRNHQLTVDTFVDQPLTDLFQGNLADICPVGALTSKDFRFKNRVWHEKQTETVCTGCSTGCNVNAHHHKGKIFRYTPRENQEVNRWWMCDPGRISFHDLIDPEKRLANPIIKGEESDWESVQTGLKSDFASLDTSKVKLLVIASPQSTVEELFALKKFAVKNFTNTQLLMPEVSKDNEDKETFVSNLISNDKAPNSKAAELLGYATGIDSIDWSNVGCAIIAGTQEIWSDKVKDALSKVDLLVAISPFKLNLEKSPKYILPSQTHLEKRGHFINKKNRLQRISPATRTFEASKNEIQILSMFNNILHENEENWNANSLFEEVKGNIKAFKSLESSLIPSLGIQLS